MRVHNPACPSFILSSLPTAPNTLPSPGIFDVLRIPVCLWCLVLYLKCAPRPLAEKPFPPGRLPGSLRPHSIPCSVPLALCAPSLPTQQGRRAVTSLLVCPLLDSEPPGGRAQSPAPPKSRSGARRGSPRGWPPFTPPPRLPGLSVNKRPSVVPTELVSCPLISGLSASTARCVPGSPVLPWRVPRAEEPRGDRQAGIERLPSLRPVLRPPGVGTAGLPASVPGATVDVLERTEPAQGRWWEGRHTSRCCGTLVLTSMSAAASRFSCCHIGASFVEGPEMLQQPRTVPVGWEQLGPVSQMRMLRPERGGGQCHR